jgi:hypothetical protein
MMKLTGLFQKQDRNGDTIVPSGTGNKPRKAWLVGMGYLSDTGAKYMDEGKVIEKKEQHAES